MIVSGILSSDLDSDGFSRRAYQEEFFAHIIFCVSFLVTLACFHTLLCITTESRTLTASDVSELTAQNIA